MALEKSETLEFDDQEDVEVPICFCGSLAQAVTEMTPLVLSARGANAGRVEDWLALGPWRLHQARWSCCALCLLGS